MGEGSRGRKKVAGEKKNGKTYFRNEGSLVHGGVAIQYKKIKILLQNMSFLNVISAIAPSNP